MFGAVVFQAFGVLLPLLIWTFLGHAEYGWPRDLSGRNVALVFAHPDDEVMFFGPTLNRLVRPELNNTVSLLCLSTGDADGIGATRAVELENSAAFFGIPPERVHIVDDPRLPDSMAYQWDTGIAGEHLEQILGKAGIDVVVTFDKDGVSGHPNHKASQLAAFHWIRGAPGRQVWQLESAPLPNKYLFPIDAFLHAARWKQNGRRPGETQIVATVDEYAVTRRAMLEGHVSQMRWFRYGWMYLSRYPWINRLVQLGAFA